MNRVPKALRALAAGLALAGLTAALSGCGGDPATTPFSFLPPTAVFNPSRTPTSSPTPTGPVRAADDPTWTPEQLAAVQTVDAYGDIQARFAADPPNANYGELFQAAWEPQYSKVVQANTKLASLGQKWVRESPLAIPINRTVTALATVDGHQEIHVVQCEIDNPNGQFIDQAGAPVDTGRPDITYDLTVQWVDSQQGWRVVDDRGVKEGC